MRGCTCTQGRLPCDTMRCLSGAHTHHGDGRGARGGEMLHVAQDRFAVVGPSDDWGSPKQLVATHAAADALLACTMRSHACRSANDVDIRRA